MKNKLLIVGAVAALAALVITWPMIRVAMLRKKQGIIEENGYLFDPETSTYYDLKDGAVVWKP